MTRTETVQGNSVIGTQARSPVAIHPHLAFGFQAGRKIDTIQASFEANLENVG